jgi:hypothetical protein
MIRLNETTIVRFFRIYHVTPKRNKLDVWFKQGGWGPVLALAWRGRMFVIGFHSNRTDVAYK